MKEKRRFGLLIGSAVTLALSLLFFFQFFESWQLALSDSLFLPRTARSEIVIIAIDDRSIQAIGRWPWNRSVHAKLLTLLGNRPKVIGVDVSFPESSVAAEDDALARVFQSQKNIVIPIESNTIRQDGEFRMLVEYLRPIPLFSERAVSGLVNMVTDNDGITRRTPILIKIKEGDSVDNFSVDLLSIVQGIPASEISKSIPVSDGLMRINFVGRPGTFTSYSFVDIASGTIPPETFDGKIVLIGATAIDLHDTLLVPTSEGRPMSGVEVHANVLQTILEKKFLFEESPITTMVTIAVVAIGLSFLLASIGILWGTVAAVGVIIAYIIYTFFSFDAGFIRNIVYPIVAVFAVYIAQIIYKYFVENKQKRFIRKALSFYLSESVMREVLSDPKKLMLGGVRKEITVLFSDIAGFTTISEDLPPDTLVTLLNTYLTRMTKIVFANYGVLDKYIGDAVMAFWGAPLEDAQQAIRACHAALEMQKDIEELMKDWAKMGIENFHVRIGINTGEMAVGNMGSDLRFDYTLLGDNVNLGSRLEGLNKEYNTKIIISRSTYDQVKDDVIARRLDMVAVKGKAKGLYVYELRGIGKPTGEEKDFLEAFEVARHLYKEGKFKEALAHFEQVIRQFPYDYTTKLYIQRCKEFILHPPAPWDGIYHAKSK